ncbi:MAG TPA: nuclear transport factor 2 family protein [Candidatus Dormibacteraeota bacterium]|nr:nuclear transport factor 2 family protein [Candidatus Dormibacteraeota bacterium]
MGPHDDPKLSVEDRLDIQELFARYAWSLDTGDLEGVLACFVEDGALEHQPQGRFVGREQIRQLLEDLWYSRPGWFVGRQHLANHFLITPEGRDRARVRAFFSILQHDTNARTNFVFGLGNWDNICVKRDGRWWFESVTVEKWIGEGVPWAGEAHARSTTGAASGA